MAQTLGIKLAVDVNQLLESIKTAIDKINDGRLDSKGLKLSVNVNALTANIKKAIGEINAQEKLKTKPINISASEAKLRQSIATAISNINRSGGLANKSIKVNATLNTSNIKKQIQSQLADINSKTGNVNLGTNADSQQIQDTVAKVREQLKQEGEQLKANNDYLRERNTLFAQTGMIKTSTKYGTVGENVTLNSINGNLTSVVRTVDKSRIAAEQAKATAAINKTRNALTALRAEYADTNSSKPIKEGTEDFKKLEKEYNEIIQAINKFEQADNKNTNQFRVNIEKRIADFELLIEKTQRSQYSATSLRTKDVVTSASIEANRFKEFVAQVKGSTVPFAQMKDTISDLELSLSKIKDSASLTDFLNKFAIAKSEFSALKAESKAVTSEMSQLDSVTNKITASLSVISSKSNQGIFLKNINNDKVIELRQNFTDLAANYKGLQDSLKKDSSAENVKRVKIELDALQKKLSEAVTNANKLKNSLNGIKTANAFSTKANMLQGQIYDYMRKNDKAMGVTNPITGMTYGDEMRQILNAIPNTQDLATLDKLNNQFITLRANIKAIGKEGASVATILKDGALKFIKWFALTQLIMRAAHTVSELFSTVKNLDTALVDLRKTFRGSTDELNAFYYESNRIAKQMGVTTEEIIKTAAACSRLGYSSNEAMQKMTEMSAMFAAISPDMDVEQAQNGLVSIMKAFDISPEDTLDGILSKVNVIGNTAATSNGEIVEMLQKSSAAMKVANNTLEETVALETAAVEVTRDAPGVGVAWKTISARLRGLDEETLQVSENITELTGKFADLTKTAKTPGGISLFTDESKTTYKSTYQIIKELSEIWDDLTDVETAKLGEILGGKRQLQVVAATIENFKSAEKALDNMANSAGSAEAEMETVRKSIDYTMNEFKETFTALAQDSVSREFIKDLIKMGTGLLSVIDAIVKKVGAIPALIGAVAGAVTGFKNKGKGLFKYNDDGKLTFWGAEIGKGTSIKSWFNEKNDPTGEKAQIKSQIAAVKEFDSAIKTNQMNLQTYNAVMKSSNDNVKRYGRAVMQGADSARAFKTVNKQLKTEIKQVGRNSKDAAAGTKELSFGLKALNVAGSMLISMGISFAISKIIEGISTMINWADKYSEKADELKEKSKSIDSQIESVNDQLSQTKLRIDELNKLEHPTIIQQEELDRLISTNDELERLLKSLNAQAGDAANQAADATMEWWKTIAYAGTTGFNGDAYNNFGDWAIHWMPRTFGWQKSDIKNESYHSFLSAIYDYQDLQKEIAETQKELSEATDESYILKLTDQIDDLTKKQQKAESIAKHNYAVWTNKMSTLRKDIPEEKAIYDEMSKLVQYWEFFSGATKKNLQEIVDDANFAVVRKELVALWKQGKLTEKEFASLTNSTVNGIARFKKALTDNGYTDFASVLRAISTYFEETEKNADNAANAVENFGKKLDKIHEKVDDAVTKQGKLAEAFEKMGLGAKLSAREIYELETAIPEIAKYIDPDGKDFTISNDGFRAANEELYKQIQDGLVMDMLVAKDQMDKLNEMKALFNKNLEYTKEHGAPSHEIQADYMELVRAFTEKYGGNEKDFVYGDYIDKALAEAEKAYDGFSVMHQLMNDIFDEKEMILNSISKGYENAKSEISDFNQEIQTVNSAIKTLSEDALLSYDELNELLEIDSNLKYEQHGTQYSISIESLEELREQVYKTRNDYIDNLQSIVQAEIDSAKATKEENEKKCGYIDEYGNFVAGTLQGLENAVEKVAAEEQVGIAEAQIEALEKIAKKLAGLRQDITYDDNKTDNDISNELQNNIDYYKTIIEAVKIMHEKYNDALEKEKEGLEEVKDSLKKSNDERQRELDLKEALINLENAKKRKVWVYSDDGGFRQVQDEKAVNEAAEKYRDVITDIQEAEIDKKIDEIEKKQKALEEKTKDIENLEEDINNAKTVEQAKKALGLTDENDLLNLTDAVKEGIKEGLADAIVKKDAEDNKGNEKYQTATLDDILKAMGASVTAEDIKKMGDSLPTLTGHNAAQNVANDIKKSADDMVAKVVNNTGNIINATFNINGADDPEEISRIVNRDLTNLFTQIGNAYK